MNEEELRRQAIAELSQEKLRAQAIAELRQGSAPSQGYGDAIISGLSKAPAAAWDAAKGTASAIGSFAADYANSPLIGSPPAALASIVGDRLSQVKKEQVLPALGTIGGAYAGGGLGSTLTAPLGGQIGHSLNRAIGLEEGPVIPSPADVEDMTSQAGGGLLTYGAGRLVGGLANKISNIPDEASSLREEALRFSDTQKSEGILNAGKLRSGVVEGDVRASMDRLAGKGFFEGTNDPKMLLERAQKIKDLSGQTLNETLAAGDAALGDPIAVSLQNAREAANASSESRISLNRLIDKYETDIKGSSGSLSGLQEIKNSIAYDSEFAPGAVTRNPLKQIIRREIGNAISQKLGEIDSGLQQKYLQANLDYGDISQVQDQLAKAAASNPSFIEKAARAAGAGGIRGAAGNIGGAALGFGLTGSPLGAVAGGGVAAALQTPGAKLNLANIIDATGPVLKPVSTISRSVASLFAPETLGKLVQFQLVSPPLAQLLMQSSQNKNPELKKMALAETTKERPDLFDPPPYGLASYVVNEDGKAELLDPMDRSNYENIVRKKELGSVARAKILHRLNKGEFLPIQDQPIPSIDSGFAPKADAGDLSRALSSMNQPSIPDYPMTETDRMIAQMNSQNSNIDGARSGYN